jgi:hypothetical protein
MNILRDHVPLPDDQVGLIAASLERQRLNPVPEAAKRMNSYCRENHHCLRVPFTQREI